MSGQTLLEYLENQIASLNDQIDELEARRDELRSMDQVNSETYQQINGRIIQAALILGDCQRQARLAVGAAA